MYSQILYEVADRVAVITLNRPEKLNVFSGSMANEIYDAFDRSWKDNDVGAIVLTGAGRGFCGGMDLQALGTPEGRKLVADSPLLQKFPLENWNSPKPTICAFNGTAVGVGITMAVSFDIRIGSENSKYSVPFIKLGLVPGFGGSRMLQDLVGRSRALRLLQTGEMIDAHEALRIGLIDKLVPAGEALNAAREMAKTMASYDPFVLGLLKRSVNFSASHPDIEEVLANEMKISNELLAKRSPTIPAKGAH